MYNCFANCSWITTIPPNLFNIDVKYYLNNFNIDEILDSLDVDDITNFIMKNNGKI